MAWRERVIARISALSHPAWGPEHCARLYATMRQIARTEQLDADDDVLFALAWLHDVGTFDEFSRYGGSPPECAATAAEQVLAAEGFPTGKLATVSRIIREHSFEGDTRGTIEARILKDADMLEFLGSIGLLRLLSIVGDEDWVPDPRAALTLALEFGVTLPKRLFFQASRELASARLAETVAFTDALSVGTAGFAWV